MKSFSCAVALVALLAFADSPGSAESSPGRIASYCSSSGDVCYGISRRQGAIFFELTTFARYFGRYRLCVRTPSGSVTCRSYPIRRRGRLFGSAVRWHTNFPARGPGTYSVSWKLGKSRLGPVLRFRLKPRS